MQKPPTRTKRSATPLSISSLTTTNSCSQSAMSNTSISSNNSSSSNNNNNKICLEMTSNNNSKHHHLTSSRAPRRLHRSDHSACASLSSRIIRMASIQPISSPCSRASTRSRSSTIRTMCLRTSCISTSILEMSRSRTASSLRIASSCLSEWPSWSNCTCSTRHSASPTSRTPSSASALDSPATSITLRSGSSTRSPVHPRTAAALVPRMPRGRRSRAR
eukprot:comp21936_c0_seq1/m.49977 comp21936_c0_seq1/g.49977  ORF comp21936_c0_seq1/g.49977 comp21936_c0_seq1/m.49977 type:complete len:219 (+) comp21936_c0_seq1:1013-1669(+)